MGFLQNLFGKKQPSKIQPTKEQQQHIQTLIARMDKDIENGFPQELGNTSDNAARELATLGEVAVESLTQVLHISSYAHWALGLIGSERAFQALCRELSNQNPQRVAAAASGLRVMGNPRALPLLKQHLKTEYAEVHEAVSEAIGDIERKQIGEYKWLQVDTTDPYGQVTRIWSQIDSIRDDDPLRAKAIQWHREFVQAMPSLKFRSDEERGHTWAMLGTLIYYFLKPQTSTIASQCPEAAYCYEQCLKYTPNRDDIQRNLEQVKAR